MVEDFLKRLKEVGHNSTVEQFLPINLEADLFNALLCDLRGIKNGRFEEEESTELTLPLAYLIMLQGKQGQEEIKTAIKDMLDSLNRMWVIFEITNLVRRNLANRDCYNITAEMIVSGDNFDESELVLKRPQNFEDFQSKLDEGSKEFLEELMFSEMNAR